MVAVIPPKHPHEPCSSRGWCYHAKGGLAAAARPGAHELAVARGHKGGHKGGLATAARPDAHELAVARGHKGGLANVESGQLARLHADPEWKRKNAEQLARLNADPEHQRKNAEHLARLHADGLDAKGGRTTFESGQLAQATAACRRAHPTRPELALHDELTRLGITFQKEVPLGRGMGIPDVFVGNIIGELDGGGHFAFGDPTEKDTRHDALRRAAGYVVIRDGDPLFLARRIFNVLQDTNTMEVN